MIVRDANSEDFPSIARIHAAMGSDYGMPNLAHPLFLVRKVAEGDSGLIGACCLRLTAETYLWLDPELSARCKMDAMTLLQPEVLRAAWLSGLDDVEARIPTAVERRFQKRLRLLGWTPNRDGWHPWTVNTHA